MPRNSEDRGKNGRVSARSPSDKWPFKKRRRDGFGKPSPLSRQWRFGAMTQRCAEGICALRSAKPGRCCRPLEDGRQRPELSPPDAVNRPFWERIRSKKQEGLTFLTSLPRARAIAPLKAVAFKDNRAVIGMLATLFSPPARAGKDPFDTPVIAEPLERLAHQAENSHCP
jgi:hypothetical protein